MKVEIDQAPKTEISSPNLEKNPGSTVENGHDFAGSQAVPPSSEPSPPESAALLESKPVVEEPRETRDVGPAKDSAAAMVTSPKKESGVVKPEDDRENRTATKANQTIPEIEIQREEKFQIDLMAPPPQSRSSPEREAEVNFVVTASEHKPAGPEVAAEVRPMMSKDKEDEKAAKGGGDEAVNVAEPELKKAKATVEEAESEKPPPVLIKERNIDLHLDLEKTERDSSPGNKLQPHAHKHHQQQQQQLKIEQPHTEKTAQPNSLPLPMSVASWPGGLPPMGYMAPLQGVVSMDASRIPSTPIQTMFSQPRSKRCATHCYIARNIHYLQQCMKMNPFWSAAGSAASLFGAKPCNLNVNVVPSAAELHGNIGAGRSVNSLVHDKGQGQGGLAIFPGHSGKDKGGSQAANIADTQRKQQQILLQQALPPGASPNNILHGPAAFIFPMNQQQVAAAAAASVRPGSAKSPAAAIGSVASSTTASNSASVNGSAPPGAATVSFNYPNMPASETQYLAILQNNAYPFPVPAVGAPPTYRGTHAHAQAMPFFNGSFYSSQMIHPSQLQQQQQQQHANTQPQQMQQGHQNPSISSGSSSSQKHLQGQQQRPQGSSSTNGGNGNGNLHSFPAPKNHRASQSSSQQQQTNQHLSNTHQSRQIETEVGGEDSPSTAASDGRVSRATMSMYGQNFAVPIHHQNFALMTTPPSAVAAGGANGGAGHGHQGEKKQQQQQSQQQALKAAGVEYLPQTFAMSFASINDATTMASGIDMSSMAQNHHTVLQGHPEANRHNYQMMAAQQKKNFRISVEGKTGGGGGGGGGDASSMDEEKKGVGGNKVPTTVGGQSIIFSRPLTEASVSAIQGSVIDSSTRTLNLVCAPPPQQSSRSAMPNAMGSTVNASNSQVQAHLQYQQQHLLQMQKHQHQHQQQQQQQQQLGAAAAARNKTPATSNGSVYSDHLNSSSPSAAKFTNATLSSAFPQNLVQSSSSSSNNNHPSQSHQWKNSSRATTTSQVPSSLASSTTSSLKNLTQQQQQARTQQSHTQISFGASQKSSSTVPQGQQQGPNSHSHSHSHQSSASPPMVVGSPTTSISKGGGASGSPRTSTSTSQPGNKPTAQPSSLSSQQPKNSTSVPSRKSSPVGVRNVPSILGNPHITSSSTGTKSQIQQQLPKQMVQQQQLFFSAPYLQTQGPHSTGGSPNAAVTSGYYIPRRRPEQQSQHSPATSSTGMLSLCPPATLSSTSTSDAKAAAAVAASNMKGLHAAQFAASQSSGNSHQLLPPGFSFGQAGPTAVQVKPAEQKQQPAGE